MRFISVMGYVAGVFFAFAALWMLSSGEWTTSSWVSTGAMSVMCFLTGYQYQAKADMVAKIGPVIKADENYEEYVALSKMLLKKGADKTWEEILLQCGHDTDKAREKLGKGIILISYWFYEKGIGSAGGEKLSELCNIAGIKTVSYDMP